MALRSACVGAAQRLSTAVVIASLISCSSGSSGGGYVDDGGGGAGQVLSREADLSPDSGSVQVGHTLTMYSDLITKSRDASGKITTHVKSGIDEFDWLVLESGGGTIGPDGYSGIRKLYHPPDTPGVYHVQIVAKIDPSITDTSEITVVPAPECPTDFAAADGTSCVGYDNGQICGNCSDECQFCDLLVCASGSWLRSEVTPSPWCFDGGADAGSDAAPADASSDSGIADAAE